MGICLVKKFQVWFFGFFGGVFFLSEGNQIHKIKRVTSFIRWLYSGWGTCRRLCTAQDKALLCLVWTKVYFSLLDCSTLLNDQRTPTWPFGLPYCACFQVGFLTRAWRQLFQLLLVLLSKYMQYTKSSGFSQFMFLLYKVSSKYLFLTPEVA